MRAVGLYKYLPIDDPESLIDLDIPKPEARGRDLLVRVRAVSVNPVDTKVRAPKDKVEAEPKILGWDAAGAGGVGSIAVQIAKRVAGMRVIATASRPETEAWCRELGADEVVDHRVPLKDEADYILCAASTEEHLQNMVDAVRPQGKVCLIVGVKGGKPVPINPLQSKSVALCWEYMFTRAMYETPDMGTQHDILDRAAGLFEDGTLRHTLREVLGPLNAENLREAHTRLESGRTIGKLVLSVP